MSIRERISHNLGLKLLALALAVCLWLYVAGGKEEEVAVEVPVRVTNLAQGFVLASQPPDRLEVSVVGPPTILRRLHPDEMVVSLDMTKVKAGSVAFSSLDRRVPVPAGIRVVRVAPATIELAVRTTGEMSIHNQGADR